MVVTQGCRYSPGIRGSDPLVDHEGSAEERSALARLAVPEVTSAEAFQRARLLGQCGNVGRDRQRLVVAGARIGPQLP